MATSASLRRSVSTATGGQDTPILQSDADLAKDAFFAAFESVLVNESVPVQFAGSESTANAEKFWVWVCRDIVPDASAQIAERIRSGESANRAIDALMPAILKAAAGAIEQANDKPDGIRRLTVQLGGDAVKQRLDAIMTIVRSRSLIEKARAFGKATNTIQGDQALAHALQSMPTKDAALSAPLMHALVGQSANPSRLTTAVTYLAGRPSEEGVKATGFAPLVDAMLAHAQNQLAMMSDSIGIFSDIDLVCRCLDRFHRLLRAVTDCIDLERSGRWSSIRAELIKRASARMEPFLREISANVAQALRKARDGSDRVDEDRLLAALNGMYLLVAVREARDSLALNALFEKIWAETGRTLEMLMARNLDDLRADPGNGAIAKKLEAGIKMAELRFGAEYASVMSKAIESVARRATWPAASD